MKTYQDFTNKRKNPKTMYEIHVVHVDGVVIQWAEEREGLYKVGDYATAWISQSQLDKLNNKAGKGYPTHITITKSGNIRIHEV